MDGDRNYLSLLNEQHTAFQKNEAGVDRLKDELTYFESFIPGFFSSTGEGSDIKSMYQNIRLMMEGTEKTISSIDVNKGSHIYKEYLEGMMQFIHDIENVDVVTEAEQLSSLEEKFNRAKANDEIFINSLYGGNTNGYCDMVLSEAVSNIEYLIDFIPEIKTMRTQCDSIMESVTDTTDASKKTLVENCLTMLYESVDNYCYNTLKSIITTYYDINDALNTKETVETSKKFQLF